MSFTSDTSLQQNRSSDIPFAAKLIATGLFSGYSPVASGTIGSLVGVLIYLIPGIEQPLILFAAIVLFLIMGAMSSATVARVVGNKLNPDAEIAKSTFQPGHRSEADPSMVVIDEIVGVWISLLLLPKTWLVIALAFVLFRVFDTVKPFPVRRLESIPHGWGIMLDDVGAAVYTNIAVRIVLLLFPGIG